MSKFKPDGNLKMNGQPLNRAKLSDEIFFKYLTSNRRKVIDEAVAKGYNENELCLILKQEIKKLLSERRMGRDVSSIKYSDSFYKLISNFNLQSFIDREWAYRPQFIKQKDYLTLQAERKIPLHFEDLNHTDFLCEFPNNFQTESHGEFEKEFKEPQFFINEKDSMLFAKLARVKYVPTRLKTVRETAEKGELDYNDQSLFDCVMSISFCVVIDGKTKNSLPLYRYDSSKLIHKNMFVGDDYRKDVFGQTVRSPHFHFQNEDDSLLCLKRQFDKRGREVYKSGRCNAIDCEGLRQYLIRLDRNNDKQIETLSKLNLHYGMPFLRQRREKLVSNCDFISEVRKFIKKLPNNERVDLLAVEKWLSQSDVRVWFEDGSSFAYEDCECFGSLIKALNFIQFVFDRRVKAKNTALVKNLSKIELLVASKVIDSFAGVENLRDLVSEGYVPHKGLRAIEPEEKE